MPSILGQVVNDDTYKLLIALGLAGSAGGFKVPAYTAKTANYTVDTTVDPCGTVFTNRGAAGTITITLPAASQALRGYFYDFLTVVAQIMTVQPGGAGLDLLITDNDATADSLSTAARIGTRLRFECDGTSWIATLQSGIPQAAFAQTGTVAT